MVKFLQEQKERLAWHTSSCRVHSYPQLYPHNAHADTTLGSDMAFLEEEGPCATDVKAHMTTLSQSLVKAKLLSQLHEHRPTPRIWCES